MLRFTCPRCQHAHQLDDRRAGQTLACERCGQRVQVAQPRAAATPGAAAAPGWLYARDGKQAGPVSFDQLQQFAAAGKLRPTDLVYLTGTPDWKAAGDLPGLFGSNPLAKTSPATFSPVAPQRRTAKPVPAGHSPKTPAPPTGGLSRPALIAIIGGGAFLFVGLGLALAIYCFTAGSSGTGTPGTENTGGTSGPPLSARQKKINASIAKGVVYLRQRFHQGGNFYSMGDPQGGAHPGAVALLGLTLLECEAGPNDPDVKKVAADVRLRAPSLQFTYSIAVSILFLDRLHSDPKAAANSADKQLIKTLALRLIASQNRNAGWGYFCRTLGIEEERTLLTNLEGNRYQAGDFFQGNGGRVHDDNSIGQFVTLALWAARKHKVPVREPLLAVERRYRQKQRPDGSWSYHDTNPYLRDTSTCAALIGLAVGRGVRDEAKGGVDELLKDKAVANGLQHLKGVVGTDRRVSAEDRARKLEVTLELERVLAALEKANDLGEIQRLQGRLRILDNSRQNRGMYFDGDNWGDLYFLWSLERMAVIYDLKKVGDADWHQWGTDIILEHQQADGSWSERFPGIPDTCFALLFLRRANLVKDLTDKLREMAGRPGAQAQPKRRD